MSTRSALPDWLRSPRARPLCIAHRGASDHAHDNSAEAFEHAVALGADWFEVDVRTTADGHLVAWHDPTTRQLVDETSGGEPKRIDALGLQELHACAAAANRRVLLLDEVLAIGAPHGIGIYVDAKDAHAVMHAADHLVAAGIEPGVIASYNVKTLHSLGERGCPYPRSILVPAGGDPVALASRADAAIVHLCWANATEAQQGKLDRSLLDSIHAAGLAVVLWHQEDPATIEHWLRLPVLGICSNRPELLRTDRP